ncbi:hypothetical protein RIR_jg2841.t1 [Rhizophagus irregularis DAOM 181602=DAOM 197198]|nr:hypothetical protein RIR_jg2841.t1 [Rhizophagus irregularis DAOM 181602=DAOM 197198]
MGPGLYFKSLGRRRSKDAAELHFGFGRSRRPPDFILRGSRSHVSRSSISKFFGFPVLYVSALTFHFGRYRFDLELCLESGIGKLSFLDPGDGISIILNYQTAGSFGFVFYG